MKNSSTSLLLLILFCFAISCEETEFSHSKITKNSITAKAPLVSIIIKPGEHAFTDVEVCKDGTVYLLEKCRLKKLNGRQLTEVNLPASVYRNFNPEYLAVAGDNTIYLRASNGIKKIKLLSPKRR